MPESPPAIAQPRVAAAGLWRDVDFLKLWAGSGISSFGSQISLVAIPVMAVTALEATPLEMGMLAAFEFVPALLLELPAGVWADRLRRRRLMIGADVGRGLIMGSIAIAALMGRLAMRHLYVGAFVAGCLSVFFDASRRAYLPALLGRKRVVDGNGKLSATGAAAQIAGASFGGALVQWIGAPVAVALDAFSFIASALFLRSIGAADEPAQPQLRRRRLTSDLEDGVRFVLKDRVLLAVGSAAGAFNFFGSMMFAVYFVFVTRDLGLPPATLGILLSTFGAGALAGSISAGPVSRRLGLGPAIAYALVVAGIADSLIPLAGQVRGFAAPLLLAAQGLIGFAGTAYFICQLTLQQAVTPGHLRGRVTATIQFFGLALLPAGSLAGGWLGKAFGTQIVMVVGGAGTLLTSFSMLASLRGIRGIVPGGADAEAERTS